MKLAALFFILAAAVSHAADMKPFTGNPKGARTLLSASSNQHKGG